MIKLKINPTLLKSLRAECIWSGLTRLEFQISERSWLEWLIGFEFWHSDVTWSFGGIWWWRLMTFLSGKEGVLGTAVMEWGDAFWKYPALIVLMLTSWPLLEVVTSWQIRVLLLNLAGDHFLLPGKEVRHFQLPRCRNKNALPPMGLSSALCKGIGPFGVLFDLLC